MNEETRIDREKEMNEDFTGFCEIVKTGGWVYCIPGFRKCYIEN